MARASIATILILVGGLASASAQSFPPSGGRDQVCQRLEAQLASIDRSGGDPARAEQIRRLEDMAGRQQAELDRATQQSRRLGCEASGFFQLFGGGGRSDQCGPLNNQIQQMRSNLSRSQGELQRLQGAGAGYERDNQRRAVLTALSQNDCGPQYRSQAAATTGPRNFFEQLFGGPGSIVAPEQDPNAAGGVGGAYRTVCVRTCDGYFFPISFSTSQERFQDDEMTCQRMCPAAEVALYSHRNPGEDMRQAVSTGGRLYTELPNAFKYKTEFNSACSCKQAGESWADAVKDDPSAQTGHRGDIVVTEDRARQMSAPRDAKGRPIPQPAQKAGQKGVAPAASNAAPVPAAAETPTAEEPAGEKKPIRSVGPKFLQTQ